MGGLDLQRPEHETGRDAGVAEGSTATEAFVRSPGTIGVLVVDDDPVVRRSLMADLDSMDGVTCVGQASNGQEAVERVLERMPDVVLMDVHMPVMDGVEATRTISVEAPSVRVLMLSAVGGDLGEEVTVFQAVKAGAAGYLLKSEATRSVLADALRRTADGEPVFTPALAGLILEDLSDPAARRDPGRMAPVLTGREVEVLTLFSEGSAYDAIAERLAVPLVVVRNQLRSILMKLQLHQLTVTSASGDHRAPPRIDVAPARRRPSGERPWLEHDLRGGARAWLVIVGLIGLAVALGVAGTADPGGYLSRADMATARWAAGAQQEAMRGLARALDVLASHWGSLAMRWGTIGVLLLHRRWQQLAAFVVSFLIVGAIAALGPAAPTLLADRAAGLLSPSAAVAILAVTLFGAAYALAPAGRWRIAALSSASGVVVLAAIGEVVLGHAFVSQVLAGAVYGIATPVVTFRLLAPEATFPVTYSQGKAAHLDIDGRRASAIRDALHAELGLDATGIERFGLAGSGGSTPLRIRVAGDPDGVLFGKLYALTHMRSDRWYKLGRTVLYGELEDEKPYNSVRRLVEYEDYMLRVMADAAVPSAWPYGFVELTPEREYLLLTEMIEDAREITDAQVDDATIRDGLTIVRRLWDAGLAHRDVKPSNVLVAGGKVYLIDVAFAQVRPSPWREAVDLANMMLVLALGSTPEAVYREAIATFSPDEVAEAFAATRSVTMPRQLRTKLKEDGRDLVGEFRALAPRREPIRIQRWSVRRVALTTFVALLFGLAVALIAGNLRAIGLG